MINLLGRILGSLFNFVYQTLTKLGDEPQRVSYLALTIIITTFLVKLMTLPLKISSTKKMKKTQDLQPQVKEIQQKFKHDPQAANMKVMELYRKNGASMTGGCLPLLIQFPILIAFWQVTSNPQNFAFTETFYKGISKTFFWIDNLVDKDPLWYGLPLIAAVLTFLGTLTTPKAGQIDEKSQESMQMMNFIFPFVTFYFAKTYSAGLALYWATSSLFDIIQQLISGKIIKDEGVKVLEEINNNGKNR